MVTRLEFSAGALIRGELVRRIRSFLFHKGATFTLDEQRGLFDTDYYLTIHGEDAEDLAKRVRACIQEYK